MGIKWKQLFKPILAFLLLALVILSSMGYLDSYKDVANAIGSPKAVRAVGAANDRNPIFIYCL